LTINTALNTLLNGKNISKYLHKKFYINYNCKLGTFKILPKIHKNKFGTRPIINCIDHPTSRICLFVDLVLQQYINSCKIILKDSQQLIQQLEELSFNNDKLFLYSCDFESLYTNIKGSDAIYKICSFLNNSNLFNNQFFDIIAFKTFLELIFNNAVFKFDKYFYRQILGLPMGCKCGPSIANIYLYILEKNWVSLNPDKFYRRFIDDQFIISKTEIDIDFFKSQFLYLKINIVTNNVVNFLDLNIEYDSFTGKIKFSLYYKPTNTFSYLSSISNHPSHIFTNIPKSILIRYRRNNSSYIDYLHSSRIAFKHLIDKGYNPIKVSNTSRQIANTNRSILIPYKDKTKLDNNNISKVFFKYDNSTSFMKDKISSSFNNFRANHQFLLNKKLFFINNMKPNIGNILINNHKLFYNKKFFCNKCEKQNCTLCNYINKSYYFKHKHFYIPILNNSNCNSIGIVYIIKCNLCNEYYIGQSQFSATIRIKKHLYDINNTKKNFSFALSNLNNISEVSKHFLDKFHKVNFHFSFFIIKSGLIDYYKRLSLETDLINIFRTFNIPCINKKINNIESISSLSFL
jgi:hypothetical protein